MNPEKFNKAFLSIGILITLSLIVDGELRKRELRRGEAAQVRGFAKGELRRGEASPSESYAGERLRQGRATQGVSPCAQHPHFVISLCKSHFVNLTLQI